MKITSLLFCLVCSFIFSSPSFGAGLKEMWYMNRGRSNMEISNYKAAIEAFEQALVQNPDNKEASHTLGLAYEKQGMNDKALNQFKSHLEKYPADYDIAFRAATILSWKRYSYRKKDAIKYYRMGLKHHSNPKIRRQYAQLLSASKETSPEAIRQYKRMLRSNSKDISAHRGIAKSYAWLGENDKALYHTNLAIKHGGGTEMASLKKSLRKGREPQLGGDVLFFLQAKEPYDLNGIQISGLGERDLGAFITVKGKAGIERYWNKDEDQSSTYVNLEGTYRYSQEHSFYAKLGRHNLPQDGTVYTLQYNYVGDNYIYRPGFKKELRYDSFMALVGSDETGEFLGAARDNKVYVTVEGNYKELPFKLTPYMGWISSVAETSNSTLGADLQLAYQWRESKDSNTFVDSYTHFSHYGTDHSGFSKTNTGPRSGGYFSPSFYFDQTILLRHQWATENDSQWRIEGGPAFQFVDGLDDDNGFNVGASLLGNYTLKTADNLYIQAEVKYKQVASTYRRFTIYGGLYYPF